MFAAEVHNQALLGHALPCLHPHPGRLVAKEGFRELSALIELHFLVSGELRVRPRFVRPTVDADLVLFVAFLNPLGANAAQSLVDCDVVSVLDRKQVGELLIVRIGNLRWLFDNLWLLHSSDWVQHVYLVTSYRWLIVC